MCNSFVIRKLQINPQMVYFTSSRLAEMNLVIPNGGENMELRKF